MNARRNDVTQNPLEAPGSDHRSGEALARPIGRVVRGLVAPALAIMNGMNYVLKFLLVGLLLLLPFAYVTHLMVEASKKQSSFNQKESYAVETSPPPSICSARSRTPAWCLPRLLLVTPRSRPISLATMTRHASIAVFASARSGSCLLRNALGGSRARKRRALRADP